MSSIPSLKNGSGRSGRGVSGFWIVDPPEEIIEIYVNGPEGFSLHAKAEKEGRVGSSLYPELVVDLTEFFTDA